MSWECETEASELPFGPPSPTATSRGPWVLEAIEYDEWAELGHRQHWAEDEGTATRLLDDKLIEAGGLPFSEYCRLIARDTDLPAGGADRVLLACELTPAVVEGLSAYFSADVIEAIVPWTLPEGFEPRLHAVRHADPRCTTGPDGDSSLAVISFNASLVASGHARPTSVIRSALRRLRIGGTLAVFEPEGVFCPSLERFGRIVESRGVHGGTLTVVRKLGAEGAAGLVTPDSLTSAIRHWLRRKPRVRVRQLLRDLHRLGVSIPRSIAAALRASANLLTHRRSEDERLLLSERLTTLAYEAVADRGRCFLRGQYRPAAPRFLFQSKDEPDHWISEMAWRTKPAEERSRYRRIAVYAPLDRLFLGILTDELTRRVDPRLHPSLVGGRPGKSISDVARLVMKALRGGAAHQGTDITKFHDSLRHDAVIAALENHLPSEMLESLRFLLGGLGDGAGIPNGCPIAAICGNAVLDHHALRRVEIPADTTVTVFIDDMEVIGRPDSVARTTRELRAAFLHVGLEPHPRKSDPSPQRGPLEFLGLLIDEESTSIPAEVASRLRSLVMTMSPRRQHGLLAHYLHCLTSPKFQEVLLGYPWNEDLLEYMSRKDERYVEVRRVGQEVETCRSRSVPLTSPVQGSSGGCHQSARRVPKRDESARRVGSSDVPHPRRGRIEVDSCGTLDPAPQLPFSTVVSSDEGFREAASAFLQLIRKRHQPSLAAGEIHPIALVSARHAGHVDHVVEEPGTWPGTTERSTEVRPALVFTDRELDFDLVVGGACPDAQALGLESSEFSMRPEDALTECELEIRSALLSHDLAAEFLALQPYLRQRHFLRVLRHAHGIERGADVTTLSRQQIRRALRLAIDPELHTSHEAVCDSFLVDNPWDRWSPQTISALPCHFYPCIPGSGSENWRTLLRDIAIGLHSVVALDLTVPDGRWIREPRYARRDVLREIRFALEVRRSRGHPDPQLYMLIDQVRYPSGKKSWGNGPSDASYLQSLGGEFLYRSNGEWRWWPESRPSTVAGSLASLADAPTLTDVAPVALAQA